MKPAEIPLPVIALLMYAAKITEWMNYENDMQNYQWDEER